MSMLSSAFCLKCVHMYDLESRKMCTGKCNHSICESCFDKKLSNSCPTCEAVNAFEVKNINYQAQEMLCEVMKNISIDDRLKGVESRNIGEGACSECRGHSSRLRVCADCSTKSGLLILNQDGSLRLSPETANELLETKILRIQSVAICADCALDGTNHRGHKLVFATNVKHMTHIVKALDAFSAISLASKKVEEQGKGCKQMTDLVKICSGLEEAMKISKFVLWDIEENRKDGAVATGFSSIFKIAANCAAGLQPYLKQILSDEIQEAKEIMRKAESEKERKEWEMIIKKLEYYHEHCNSEGTGFDWKSNVLETIKFCESGMLREIMKISTNQADIRKAYDLSKDLRRTLKLPREVEKYVNVAGSVLQFFLAGEEKKKEEMDLD